MINKEYEFILYFHWQFTLQHVIKHFHIQNREKKGHKNRVNPGLIHQDITGDRQLVRALPHRRHCHNCRG
jgi:hypothetical protein